MSNSSLKVTSCPESGATKIYCFGCHVPSEEPPGLDATTQSNNEDFDDPLKEPDLSKPQSYFSPVPDDGILENIGIVGTITLLGRSTAMVWVGWGRLHDELQHSSKFSVASEKRHLGTATNLPMGPLMVSMPRRSYQGAFASHIPSSKLISVSDLESDLMASQMAERLSEQLQMAILVSCHFDDAHAPKNTAIAFGSDAAIESHVLRRRAMTIAETEICKLIQINNKPSFMLQLAT